ncbi:HTH_48 domain-containing protein [Trichonephila clavata]|uniref:HTH_48 domain-containing protein n=1 Tax=Trichonephila clavata TaxID=2740835 RepID=A0A8X6GPX0_TRICU|nr:HTH_48 domain-containing protein [Trichonephila clavata]
MLPEHSKENLDMWRVSQHIIPRLLTTELKMERMTISGHLIDKVDKIPWILNHVITGDETGCYLFDIQLKHATSTWKSPSSPRSKKFRQHRSKGKIMMEVFFDSLGTLLSKFITESLTGNKEHYLCVLRHLRDSIRPQI